MSFGQLKSKTSLDLLYVKYSWVGLRLKITSKLSPTTKFSLHYKFQHASTTNIEKNLSDYRNIAQ